MILVAATALLGFPTVAQSQQQLSPASCKEDPYQCLAACQAALDGLNDMFEVLPVPDLAAIRARALTADRCEALVSDRKNEVNDALQKALADVLSDFPADRTTASSCAFAITTVESAHLEVGTKKYDEMFATFGCPEYARIGKSELANSRYCAEEKAKFEALMASTDWKTMGPIKELPGERILGALRAFDSSVRCREYKAEVYVRLSELVDAMTAAGLATEFDL